MLHQIVFPANMWKEILCIGTVMLKLSYFNTDLILKPVQRSPGIALGPFHDQRRQRISRHIPPGYPFAYVLSIGMELLPKPGLGNAGIRHRMSTVALCSSGLLNKLFVELGGELIGIGLVAQLPYPANAEKRIG